MKTHRTSPTSPTVSAPAAPPAAAKRRAMKVRFYRNGDRHYPGYQMAVSSERYRTFDALLNDLTDGPVCDRNVLPQGVRCLFSLAGQRVRDLQEMSDGAAYVCASFDQFKRVDYGGKPALLSAKETRDSAATTVATPRTRQQNPQPLSQSQQSQLKPKFISVLQGGGGAARPRRAARYLLNSRTAKSFDRVMSDISQAVRLPTGAVRKLFTIDGKLVTCLEDLLGEMSVFIAYGNEKMNSADFVLDDTDYKSINSQAKSQLKSRVAAFPGTPAVGYGATSTSQQLQRKPSTRRMQSSSPLAEEDPDVDASASTNGSETGGGPRCSDLHGNSDGAEDDAFPTSAKPPPGRDSFDSDRLCDRMSGALTLAAGAAAADAGASLGSSSGQLPLADELRMATGDAED